MSISPLSSRMRYNKPQLIVNLGESGTVVRRVTPTTLNQVPQLISFTSCCDVVGHCRSNVLGDKVNNSDVTLVFVKGWSTADYLRRSSLSEFVSSEMNEHTSTHVQAKAYTSVSFVGRPVIM